MQKKVAGPHGGCRWSTGGDRKFQSNGEIDGAWSKNKSFVTVAEDYVKHDVYITKVTRFLGPEVVKRFGENYDRLRDVFNSEA